MIHNYWLVIPTTYSYGKQILTILKLIKQQEQKDKEKHFCFLYIISQIQMNLGISNIIVNIKKWRLMEMERSGGINHIEESY